MKQAGAGSGTGLRTGAAYLESLRDGRTVFVDGERAADVTLHPAFQGICDTVRGLYDYAADSGNDMSAIAPETGRPANRVYMIPRTGEELRRRREAISGWSRLTHGFVGRGPDHVAGFFAGFASKPAVFARGGARFGSNVSAFHRRMPEESLYLSYVIIPPQVDRSSTAQNWQEKFIQVGVCAERDNGIIVRGAQMLGTASAVSNYIFVSCIVPLKPGDEDYALSFVVPVEAPGLKLYCRRPYAPAAPSSFDYPLSTRFDESDALVVFDNVIIPWEHVFMYRSGWCGGSFSKTPAHVLGNTQAQTRLVEKLKFILGLARKVAATTKIDQIPGTQEKLGELASLAAIVEGMMLAAEATCSIQDGVAVPNPRFLYGAMGLQAELYPRVIRIVRELAGGGVLQVPASVADMLGEHSKADIQRYIASPGVPSAERIKLFKAAWDVIGSEFGGRHQQYEMFYAGAPHIARGYAFRNYGYEEAVALAEGFLNSYDVEGTR